jgi:hypothetical protein
MERRFSRLERIWLPPEPQKPSLSADEQERIYLSTPALWWALCEAAENRARRRLLEPGQSAEIAWQAWHCLDEAARWERQARELEILDALVRDLGRAVGWRPGFGNRSPSDPFSRVRPTTTAGACFSTALARCAAHWIAAGQNIPCGGRRLAGVPACPMTSSCGSSGICWSAYLRCGLAHRASGEKGADMTLARRLQNLTKIWPAPAVACATCLARPVLVSVAADAPCPDFPDVCPACGRRQWSVVCLVGVAVDAL